LEKGSEAATEIPHPGGFMLRHCVEPLGLTITAAAAALGVTRTILSELVNEKRGISPEMAVRLAKVFGGSAQSWLTQQSHEADMTQSRFPPGWDEERVRRVLAHYEQQTPEEAVAEDEAAFVEHDDTVMKVPHDLVPAVRQLIAKHQE
jgi:addiction module HigA family antidote